MAMVLVACAGPGVSGDPTSSEIESSVSDRALPESPDSCPAGVPSLADVIGVPIADRPDCFGTGELTLTGWVFEELDPVYDCVSVPQQPEWLSCILLRQQLVAEQRPPAPWSEDLASLWVAADPDGPVGAIRFNAREGPVPLNTWVEVRGHFSDPAAEDCGPPGDPLRIECEGSLVLTGATVIAPDATPVGLASGSFASVTVNGLTVRSEAAATASPVECPGAEESVVRLEEGTVVLVLDDAPVNDGAYIWHHVVAPADDGAPAIGSRCDDIPLVAGWVASSRGPDEWLVQTIACPPEPSDLGMLADVATEPLRGLACFGPDEIRVTAELAPPPDGGIGFSCPGVDPAWLTCGIDRLVDGSTTVAVRLPEGVTEETGVPAVFALHFDDPAAAACRSLADVDDDPAVIELFCRTQLVLGP